MLIYYHKQEIIRSMMTLEFIGVITNLILVKVHKKICILDQTKAQYLQMSNPKIFDLINHYSSIVLVSLADRINKKQ